MYTPTFRIMMELRNGEILPAFTWCRDAASGLERAAREAAQFGFDAVRFWAEPVELEA